MSDDRTPLERLAELSRAAAEECPSPWRAVDDGYSVCGPDDDEAPRGHCFRNYAVVESAGKDTSRLIAALGSIRDEVIALRESCVVDLDEEGISTLHSCAPPVDTLCVVCDESWPYGKPARHEPGCPVAAFDAALARAMEANDG